LLGQVYSNRGDYVQAEHLFRKALQLCPEYPTARNNLATVLMHQGKEKEAESFFTEATKAAHETRKDYPRTWMAALNLAHMRQAQHDYPAAISILEKAREDYPNTWELIRSESEILRENDKLNEALALIRPFAEKNWWHHDAWLAMGRLFAQKADVDAAASALRHASWLDMHETEALNLMAILRMRQNRLEDAVQTQRRAVARQPDQPQQYLLLSDLLGKMGRADESRAALAEVSRLRSLAGSEKVVN
jgi:Flp pilus assembly protein TadD